MRTGAAAGHRGYFHETAFYGSDDEFLGVIVPFFTDGLEAGEPVVSAFTSSNQRLVREVFGDDHGIWYLGGERQYLRPAGAIRRYRDLFAEHVALGANQIRVAGDVPHPGVGAPWGWWARYEAAVNHAYNGFPVWGMCPYDIRTTPEHVLADVRRTHPHVARGREHSANPTFEDPIAFLLSSPTDGWRDPLEQSPPRLELVGPSSARARNAISEIASTTLPADDCNGLVHSVSEAVTNAIMYGRGPVVMRAWSSPSRVLVTVTDTGDGPMDPYAGLVPSRGYPSGGMGLWLMHQMCSFVSLQRGPEGFTVRLVAGVPAC
jgi:anti-sigma regulatory factor (Ser/Thr protein kinase)